MHVLSYFQAAKVRHFCKMGFIVYIQYFVLCNIGVISTIKQGATDNIDHKKQGAAIQQHPVSIVFNRNITQPLLLQQEPQQREPLQP